MSSSPTFSPQTDPWQELNGYCAPDVIRAPKTWGDPLSSMLMDSPQNIQAVVGYVLRNLLGCPWKDHLRASCRSPLQPEHPVRQY